MPIRPNLPQRARASVGRAVVVTLALALALPSLADALPSCEPVTEELCRTIAGSSADANRQRETSAAGDVQRVTQTGEGVGRWHRASQACQTARAVGSPRMLEAFWAAYGEAMGGAVETYICDASPFQPPPTAAVEEVARTDAPLLLDADLGVPLGIRVGYAPAGVYWGIGVRAAIGPAMYIGRWEAVGLLGAFGEIPLGWEGVWRIEPSASLAITGVGVGPMGGVDLHGVFSPNQAFSGGFRAGLDVGVVAGGAVVVPEVSFVLSW